MATSYPSGLDNWSTISSSTGMDGVGFYHDERHNDLQDAVEAIEGELGTDPRGGAASVKVRLDSHDRRGWHPLFPAAGYYHAMDIPPSAAATSNVTANRLYFRRVVLPETKTLAALGVYVSTGVTSTNVRLGAYSDSNGVPGSLLVDAGTGSTASSSTWVDVVTTQQLLGGEPYWLAAVFSGAPTILAPSGNSAQDGLGMAIPTSASNSQGRGAYHNHTYGSLPSSASALTWSTAAIPLIFVRF